MKVGRIKGAHFTGENAKKHTNHAERKKRNRVRKVKHNGRINGQAVLPMGRENG